VRAGICSSVLCTNADAVVVVSEGGTCSRLVHLRQKNVIKCIKNDKIKK